jgi:hypothetical protein
MARRRAHGSGNPCGNRRLAAVTPPVRRAVRIGIVGAARTRQGLGPFLASACENEGARVAGVAGRDREGAERAAAMLAARLGHDVFAAADAASLAREVDALVVAAPPAGHLEGLDAALAAGVPCLCEKPLVAAADAAAGLQRVAAFRHRGLLLRENCQWPLVLPALFAAYPALVSRRVRCIAMGLSPAWPGPTMLADSLSHVLSLAQALVAVPVGAAATAIEQSDGGERAERNEVRFRLPASDGDVDVVLHLQVCPEQPRPAWFEVDGCRLDRRLGPDYSHAYVGADGVAHAVRDPLHALVADFVAAVARGDGAGAAIDTIATRLRLYAQIVTALGAA